MRGLKLQMSASREKKTRRSDPNKGLTQTQRKELQEQQAAKRKAVGYTILGVIIAVLVVILLVWHSGVFQRGQTALTIGGRNYTVTDVGYYFTYHMNQSSGSFDATADLRTQYVDEEQTESYFDQFLNSAIDTLKEVAALENAAEEAGYTLSDEDRDTVDAYISQTRTQAESYGYNYAGYLKAIYGKYMTPSAYRTCLEREVLTTAYRNTYSDGLEITDEEIQTYYDENAATLDSYDYRYILVDGSAESTTDADGNTVEPTEEEQTAAMEAAQERANEFADALNASDDKEATFIELAPDYVSESNRESYEEDADRSLTTGTVGSSLTYLTYGSWLQDDSRSAGDVGVIEGSSGYYVVLLLNRYRDETPTVNIRHILVLADTAEEDDPSTEDVNESTTPTQEALDAAKSQAEDILAQWEAGDKTAESFGALAEEYSDDPGSNTNGGLYEQVYEGYMFDAFNDWIFDESRQVGDTGLVENTQSGQQGWHVIYYQGQDEPRWKLTARNAVASEETQSWLDGLTENMEAVQGSGVKYLGE